MDRFLCTLCLNGVRTSDNIPLHVVDAQTLSLDGTLVSSDDIVERALPSRVATAIESSMAAAPAFSSSVFFLLGAQVHHGRLGDAVVHYIIRDQAKNRSKVYERQVLRRPVVTVSSSSATAAAADDDSRGEDGSPQPLQYEECLVFAYDDGAVACEALRASDPAATVDEVLESLRVISLAVFKYASNKTCVLLVGSHLSTAHMATLLLASRRHVFLYVDASLSAHEVAATAAEMAEVRQSLCAFARPLDEDVRQAQRWAGHDRRAAPPAASPTLDAMARSKAEYELLLLRLAQEGALHPSSPQEEQRSHERLHRELAEARAAQEAAVAALAEQRRAHREEMLAVREELRAAEEERAASLAEAESARADRPVSQNLLESFQQQQQQSGPVPSDADAAVAQLQHALQDARKAQHFAEEKLRLLELRHAIAGGPPSSALGEGGANGSVVSPRPSLRLPTTAPGVLAAEAGPAAWEQSLLQQENTALVAEFQRKEKAWQQRLREASAEVAQLRQEKAAMEATLRLQSQTIAAAQHALVESRAVQEREMTEVLQRVRTLSQESRSRHHTTAASAERSHTQPSVEETVRSSAGTPPPAPGAGHGSKKKTELISPKR